MGSLDTKNKKNSLNKLILIKSIKLDFFGKQGQKLDIKLFFSPRKIRYFLN